MKPVIALTLALVAMAGCAPSKEAMRQELRESAGAYRRFSNPNEWSRK